MSSCCGMPPRSTEPYYPLPPGLEELAQQWDKTYPGVLDDVVQVVGSGDWDAMGDGVCNIPAYAPDKAIEAALEQLTLAITRADTERRRKAGAWYVRWGLVTLGPAMSEAGQQFVAVAQQDAVALLKLNPIPLPSGAQFSYQMHYPA